MFFIFSKVLNFLLAPIVWVLILFLLSYFLKGVKKKKQLFWLAIGILYFFSNSFILDEAFRSFEERDQQFDKIEQHDIAIVLGGLATYDTESGLEQFHMSVDRFLHAIQLYKADKVKKSCWLEVLEVLQIQMKKKALF